MKRFFIHTMGCKSNQFEGSIIIENLLKNGFKQVKGTSKNEYITKCDNTELAFEKEIF